jgi:acetyl-CoA carboxylase biotin carboxyl carrier protein
MNKKEIEEFVKFVKDSGVNEVSVETKEFKITVKNAAKFPEQLYTHVTAPAMPVTSPAGKTEAATSKTGTPKEADDSKLHVIKSPMIGTFYRSASPDKPNFVQVGDEVKPGKVICIIEAMKLFNEIECDVAGKIVKVLVDNASPVEYDQPLFLVEPN